MKNNHRKAKATVELMPASLLQDGKFWRPLLRELPAGGFLFIVPSDNPRLRRCMLNIARTARKKGRPVELVST